MSANQTVLDQSIQFITTLQPGRTQRSSNTTRGFDPVPMVFGALLVGAFWFAMSSNEEQPEVPEPPVVLQPAIAPIAPTKPAV